MYHGTIANRVPLLLHGTPSYHSAVRLGPHTDWYRPYHNSLGGSGERCECHSVKATSQNAILEFESSLSGTLGFEFSLSGILELESRLSDLQKLDDFRSLFSFIHCQLVLAL